LYQLSIANVTLDELMARVVLKRGQVMTVTRVGQLVQIDQPLRIGRKPAVDKVTADKAGAAGDEDGHAGILVELKPPQNDVLAPETIRLPRPTRAVKSQAKGFR